MLTTASLNLSRVLMLASSGNISLSSASSKPTEHILYSIKVQQRLSSPENRISKAPEAGSNFSSIVLLVSFTALYLVLLGSLIILVRSLVRISQADFFTSSPLSLNMLTSEVSTSAGASDSHCENADIPERIIDIPAWCQHGVVILT